MMRRLFVTEYLSLDGVLQAPGHAGEDQDGNFRHGGWTGPYMPDHVRLNSISFQRAGAFLFGRRTYEIFAQYWPLVTDEGDPIARALNTQPKYVASRTLANAGWPGTAVIRDVPGEVAALKQQPGLPIFVTGSSGLAQTLIEHDLIDEYELWLHPVILGSGKRLFRGGALQTGLRLTESRTTSTGLVLLTYQRER
jgi:dihydrofolate reductase